MTSKKIKDLVNQAQLGDKEALGQLYSHFYNQIYYYTYSRINNIHETQEIVSDSFLSMVEGIKKYQGKSTFKNYLFGIIKNKIRDYIRNKYKYSEYVLQSNMPEETFDNIEAPLNSSEEDLYRTTLRSAFQDMVQSMKPRYAKVLDLRFNQMHSVEETAKLMNTSTNNIKVIQHRAIKQAKTMWEQHQKIANESK